MHDVTEVNARRDAIAHQARENIVRLVDFLKDYDGQKNPPVTDIETYRLFTVREEDLPHVPGLKLTGGAPTWLSVQFVDLPPVPAVPDDISRYLRGGASISPTVRPEPYIPADELPVPWPGTPEYQFAPSEQARRRLGAAEQWVEQRWAPWSQSWREARQAKDFYRRLFEQQQLIANDREMFELVWGFGRLRWAHDQGAVYYPLFTVTVEVTAGEDNALRLSPSGPLEVETLPFANLPVADRAALSAVREAVAAEPFDPWADDALSSETRAVVRALHHDGVLAGEGAPHLNGPVADGGWVLFTRRRRPDRQGFLDAMRDLYAGGVVPPDALSSIVVDSPSVYAAREVEVDPPGGDRAGAVPATSEPQLLPLPSNEEQQRILVLAQRQSGVVVQGPPGTGKSHTIANLISHYVAYGQRVLVVAEKEQALTVLGEKIPEEIRELAVLVLGSDAAGRRALEAAISSIQARVSHLDRRAEDRRGAELSADLAAMDARIARTTERLLASRRSETVELPGRWPVHPATPERAAAWVAEHEDRLGYIPDRLDPSQPIPMTSGELGELRQLLREIGVDDYRQSAFVLPELARLPTQASLLDTLALRDKLRVALSTASAEVSDWSDVDRADPGQVAALRERTAAELSAAQAAEQPWLRAIAGQLRDPLLRQSWQQFVTSMHAEREQLLAVRPGLTAHQVEVPANIDPAFVARLEQARKRLDEHGRLGMFAGDLKRTLQACRVDGAVPATADAVALCQLHVQIERSRRALRTRWVNHVGHLGGPDVDPGRPEDQVGLLTERVAELLRTPQRWQTLAAELQRVGITVPGAYGPATLQRVTTVLELAATRQQERAVTADLESLAAYLREGARQPDASPLWHLLDDCLAGEVAVAWGRHRDAVAGLVKISAAARRLAALETRLRAGAPLWATAILADPEAVREPALLPDAWQWRQLDTWVASVINGDSPQDLQRELEALGVARRRLVAELVGVRAWRRLADHLGDRQRQALNSYLAATKRYGKTGGKFAARWLAAIREALNESKDAVPVWIMTTARALASFRPEEQVPFDVLIVDEASQIGIDALPLLALARRAIVVGDDKQTSPSAVGMDQQKVFELIDTHLAGIRHHRVLFNPTNSLYDLAFQKFPSSVMLREHFRCLPEIIAFSNRMFYGDRIEPLRENRPAPGWNALGAVTVLDGYRDRSIDANEPEANVVADLIAKMADDPVYDGMDFGVVCLLSGSQAHLIRTRLFDRLGPQVVTERRIRVGDAANFQGDERDVMIISTVVAADPANPNGRIGAVTGVDAEQRINVAASRARDQMILVHSVDPERLPASDLRAHLIRHCRSGFEPDTDAQSALERCESEFERLVLRRIRARGYARVRSQVQVGTGAHSYRIGLVVDGPESRLAVECDGERWHGEERWHAERARQEVLERAGWTFCRIRGSAFFRDPDAALQPLWERLDELAIPSGQDWLDGTAGRGPTVVEVRGADLVFDEQESRADAPEAAEPVGPMVPSPPGDAIEAVAAGPQAPQSAAAPGGGRHRIAARVQLLPYPAFQGGPFAAVSMDHLLEIGAGLREIVAAEGPVLALRAHQLYVEASGAQRVGTEMRRILNAVAHEQMRAGAIAWIRDGAAGMIDRTLYLPGSTPVLVRELGPRRLLEVPKSEVRALIDALGLSGDSGEGVSRAVLEVYGLARLAGRAAEFIVACQSYEWTVAG